MNSIFEYLDYRTFLNDFYREKKKVSPFFSYRYISSKVDMNSSFVIKVLKGKLHISYGKINAFTELLSLGEKEALYFERLVYFNKARTEKERRIHFGRLLEMKDVSSVTFEENQYEFFQKWYYSAVWSVLHYFEFDGNNIKELSEQLQPSISVREARQAVSLLEKLSLIKRGTQGLYTPCALNLTTGKDWHSLAIRQYQKELIRLGGESLDRFRKEERNVSTLTLTVSDEALPHIDEMISEFRKSLVKFVNTSDVSGRAFQLNIQLFPLSKTRNIND